MSYRISLVIFYFGGLHEDYHKSTGRANLSFIDNNDLLFQDVKSNSQVWMSHGDTIKNLASNMQNIASTIDVENAAFKIIDKTIYGIQFHPEVFHSEDGLKIIKNFVIGISNCTPNWTPDSFVDTTIKNIKSTVKNQKVVLGLSGGVDSSVSAILLHRSIGENLHCIFVDNGLLRKDEFDEVLKHEILLSNSPSPTRLISKPGIIAFWTLLLRAPNNVNKLSMF